MFNTSIFIKIELFVSVHWHGLCNECIRFKSGGSLCSIFSKYHSFIKNLFWFLNTCQLISCTEGNPGCVWKEIWQDLSTACHLVSACWNCKHRTQAGSELDMERLALRVNFKCPGEQSFSLQNTSSHSLGGIPSSCGSVPGPLATKNEGKFSLWRRL